MKLMCVLFIGYFLYQAALCRRCFECSLCGDPWMINYRNTSLQCPGPCVKVKTDTVVRRFCSRTNQTEGCVDISYRGVTTRHCVCYGQLCNKAMATKDNCVDTTLRSVVGVVVGLAYSIVK